MIHYTSLLPPAPRLRLRVKRLNSHSEVRLRVKRLIGLSLKELVFVLGLLAVLLALLLPTIQMTREGSRRASCTRNQEQLAKALHMHESAKRFLPATLNSEAQPASLFWQAQVLPYMEQESIFQTAVKEIDSGVPILRNSQRVVHIPGYQCASNPDQRNLIHSDAGFDFAFTDYCGIAGSDRDNGIFALDIRQDRTFFSEVASGLSNTVIFSERPPSDLDEGFGAWLGGNLAWSASTYTNGPRNIFPAQGSSSRDLLEACAGQADLGYQPGKRGTRCCTHHWSFHAGGANFAFADGSGTFLSYKIDKQVLANLASRE